MHHAEVSPLPPQGAGRGGQERRGSRLALPHTCPCDITSEVFGLPRLRVSWVWLDNSGVASNSGVRPRCAGVPLGRDTAPLCAAQLAAARRAFTVAAAWPAVHDACSSPCAARWVLWQLHSAHGLASAPAAAEAPVDLAAESEAAQEPVRLTDNAVQVRARAACWAKLRSASYCALTGVVRTVGCGEFCGSCQGRECLSQLTTL